MVNYLTMSQTLLARWSIRSALLLGDSNDSIHSKAFGSRWIVQG